MINPTFLPSGRFDYRSRLPLVIAGFCRCRRSRWLTRTFLRLKSVKPVERISHYRLAQADLRRAGWHSIAGYVQRSLGGRAETMSCYRSSTAAGDDCSSTVAACGISIDRIKPIRSRIVARSPDGRRHGLRAGKTDVRGTDRQQSFVQARDGKSRRSRFNPDFLGLGVSWSEGYNTRGPQVRRIKWTMHHAASLDSESFLKSLRCEKRRLPLMRNHNNPGARLPGRPLHPE